MPNTPPSPHSGPVHVAVIGGGAFGRNHLRVYRELELAHPDVIKLVALVEPDPLRRDHFAALYNIPTFASVQDLRQQLRPHAASICVPTVHHAAVASELLCNGMDVLIEKPFASTLAEADHLIALAQQHHRILAVGHLERFNPAVTSAAQAITSPMFFEAHRLSIFTPRSLDVDVVLDLMIHDLDIVLALTQSPVREVRAVGLPVLSPKTDIANVRIEFESGCIANFTASRVSTEQVRKLRLFQPHQYLSLDFARQELLTIAVDPSLMTPTNLSSPPAATTQPPLQPPTELSSRPAATTQPPLRPPTELSSRPERSAVERPAALASAAHPTPGLNLTKSTIPKGEPLRLELEDFLTAVRHRTQPRVPAEAGRAALALALEINAAIATHSHRLAQIKSIN